MMTDRDGSGRSRPAVYGVVGSGWRAGFFLEIARALPERFSVCGVVTRNAARGQELERRWGIPSYRDVDGLLRANTPDFVVVSVDRSAVFEIIRGLAEKDMPVLSETPPAGEHSQFVSLSEMAARGARIQVAEQFHFQPYHVAGLSICTSGILGDIGEAQVSINHSYHGMNLIRKYLGVGFEEATVNAFRFSSSGVAGPGRAGLGETETMRDVPRYFAIFDFGGRIGIFDYEQDQHRSWIRSRRVLVRGTRGELNNLEVRYLEDFRTPVRFDLKRENAGEDGNLEGYCLKGISTGREWIYRNPFVPARLNDEEIAIATTLVRMSEYVAGGSPFYDVADAAQDAYLWSMAERAMQTGGSVRTETQPWARNP